MIRDGNLARRVQRRTVRLSDGQAVDLTLVASFNAAGALVGVTAALPPAPVASSAETAGALLVQAIGQKMSRRPDIGITELRRRAEAALALLEQLEEIEQAIGGEARAFLAARGVAA